MKDNKFNLLVLVSFLLGMILTSCPRDSFGFKGKVPPPPETDASAYILDPQKIVSGEALIEQYAFGDMAILTSYHTMNNLETCGCSPLQMGGLAPRAELISMVRKKMPTIVIDIGAMLDGAESFNLLKARYQLKALHLAGYDALSLGVNELALKPEDLSKLLNEVDIPYYSGNAFLPKGEWKGNDTLSKRIDIEPLPKLEIADISNFLQIDETKKWEMVARPGFIWKVKNTRIGFLFLNFTALTNSEVELAGYFLANPIPLLKEYLRRFQDMADIWVLLAEGYSQTLEEELSEFPQIFILITGDFHPLSEVSQRKMLLARTAPSGRGLWLNTFYFGAYLGIVNIVENGKNFNYYGYNLPILSTYKPEEKVLKLITQSWQGELAKIFTQQSFKYKSAVIIDPQDCATCHQKAYEVYKESKHARSLEALKGKKQELNVECLSCHVVYDYAQDQMYSNQCLSCHNKITPKHLIEAQNQIPLTEKDEAQATYEFCSRCHDPKNSPLFKVKFNEYLEEVKHW